MNIGLLNYLVEQALQPQELDTPKNIRVIYINRETLKIIEEKFSIGNTEQATLGSVKIKILDTLPNGSFLVEDGDGDFWVNGIYKLPSPKLIGWKEND